jgi:hypothetical protein
MIYYSTNWMGPISTDWYRERGLTETTEHTAEHSSMFYDVGQKYTTTEITQHYSCGRIDVRGVPDEPYGLEIGVPPMQSRDWQLFGRWLRDVQTASVWTLQDLVEAYEFQTGETIHWYKESQ